LRCLSVCALLHSLTEIGAQAQLMKGGGRDINDDDDGTMPAFSFDSKSADHSSALPEYRMPYGSGLPLGMGTRWQGQGAAQDPDDDEAMPQGDVPTVVVENETPEGLISMSSGSRLRGGVTQQEMMGDPMEAFMQSMMNNMMAGGMMSRRGRRRGGFGGQNMDGGLMPDGRMDVLTGLPMTCDVDLQSYCANSANALRCLVRKISKLSDPCKVDLFLAPCKGFVNKHCDLLEQGILGCLNMKKSDLQPQCRTALRKTQDALSGKWNTPKQKNASKAGSGEATATTKPLSLKDREANADATLGSAVKATEDGSPKVGVSVLTTNSKAVAPSLAAASTTAPVVAAPLEKQLDAKLGAVAGSVAAQAVSQTVSAAQTGVQTASRSHEVIASLPKTVTPAPQTTTKRGWFRYVFSAGILGVIIYLIKSTGFAGKLTGSDEHRAL